MTQCLSSDDTHYLFLCKTLNNLLFGDEFAMP